MSLVMRCRNSKIIFLLFLILQLSNCQIQSSRNEFDYLLEHPNLLKQELIRCKTIQDESDDKCKLAKEISNDLIKFSEEQYADPQKFGEKILKAQMAKEEKQVKIYLAVIGAMNLD